ncbi:unnamed protein product [Cuscuta campestris]|uniref:DUF4005 domain-containing protein n=1 Tax=Cuscuta campestris TaxID=132261 RepID=A0A484LHG1_9ASTE|nr:unnamed protein product [Cuscuta campestris]
MGKKGSWFSAIKRLFTPKSSKDKEVSKKKSKAKKGKRHGESKSFIPLLREPSSIEKILEEAAADDEHRLLFNPQPKFSPNITSPRPATSPRVTSQRAASPRATSSKARRKHKEDNRYVHRPEPALEVLHAKAIMIQTAFRGYMARRSLRALRGLVRLKGVMGGNNVKKQSLNALKQMQFMVSVQTQVQCRRVQMLENQALQFQVFKNGNSAASNWTQLTGAGNTENWDDSVLTKDEIERRGRRKVEAIAKRERAMAYAYSNHHHHQKGNSQRWGLYPTIIWWSWLDDRRECSDKNALPTPTSTKSAAPMGSKQFEDKMPRPPSSSSSLTSCPPFSVPSYMAPTASAKAKAKAKERNSDSHLMGESSKRRFSYPLTPQSNVESEAEKHGGDSVSLDSIVSMSAAGGGGRKPFNRFV